MREDRVLLMDSTVRARERHEAPRITDMLRDGRLTLKDVKRMAVCGNRDAQRFLGFTRKPKVELRHVLKAMMSNCPEMVRMVLDRVQTVERINGGLVQRRARDGSVLGVEHARPKRSPRYATIHCRGESPDGWHSQSVEGTFKCRWCGMRYVSWQLRSTVFGVVLTAMRMPGFWWLGRELAKMGRTP